MNSKDSGRTQFEVPHGYVPQGTLEDHGIHRTGQLVSVPRFESPRMGRRTVYLTGVFGLCFINADVRNAVFLCRCGRQQLLYRRLLLLYLLCRVNVSLVWLHCSSYVSYLMLHLIVVQMGEDTHRVRISASFSIAMCQCQIQSATAWLIYIQTHNFSG